MVCEVHLNNNGLADAAVQRFLECWMLWRLHVSSNLGINIIDAHPIITPLVFRVCFGMRQYGRHTFRKKFSVLTKLIFMKHLILTNSFQKCWQHICSTSETTLGGQLETLLQPADLNGGTCHRHTEAMTCFGLTEVDRILWSYSQRESHLLGRYLLNKQTHTNIYKCAGG